jgi:hypothetical protein
MVLATQRASQSGPEGPQGQIHRKNKKKQKKTNILQVCFFFYFPAELVPKKKKLAGCWPSGGRLAGLLAG